MTKKHFEAVARIFNQYNQDKLSAEQRLLLHSLEQDFVVYFKTQNDLFNADRFLVACNKKYSI